MKTYTLKCLAWLTAATFLFSGCDKLEEADDVSFDATFTIPQPFVVDEDQDEPENPYVSSNSSMEATQNSQVQQYIDRIKSIKVNQVNYVISNFQADGAVTLVSGSATFFATGGNAGSGVIAQVSNVPLTNHSGILQVSQEGLDTIGEIILEDGEVQVISSATLSDAPVSFAVTVTLDVTITANAL